MDKIKSYFKYIIWIVLFFIFSEFLINVGLNSNYRDIERKDNVSQVSIYQADATKVNGRIRGIIKNSAPETNFGGKYIKIDFYSKRDVNLGKKYIEIGTLKEGETKPFEVLFKLKDVDYYEVSVADQKDQGEEIEILPKEWTRPEILLATAFTFLIFWG